MLQIRHRDILQGKATQDIPVPKMLSNGEPPCKPESISTSDCYLWLQQQQHATKTGSVFPTGHTCCSQEPQRTCIKRVNTAVYGCKGRSVSV